MGDLNLLPAQVDSRIAGAGLTLAGGGPTFPARRPRRRIDHIAADGFRFGAIRTPKLPVSDHRPLVAELERLHEGD